MIQPPRAVLLRGVNVGGKNLLRMADFHRMLTDLGLRRVETLIQSGNAVFCGGPPDGVLAPLIRKAIAQEREFSPDVFLRDLAAMETALDHPFGPDADPARIHAVFLSGPQPALDNTRLAALRGDEDWALRPGMFLLHTPSGMGRSKLATALPRLLPVPQTARNLKTVARLAGLLRSRIRDDGAG